MLGSTKTCKEKEILVSLKDSKVCTNISHAIKKCTNFGKRWISLSFWGPNLKWISLGKIHLGKTVILYSVWRRKDYRSHFEWASLNVIPGCQANHQWNNLVPFNLPIYLDLRNHEQMLNRISNRFEGNRFSIVETMQLHISRKMFQCHFEDLM